MAGNINTSGMSNRITGYGDWSATAVLSDGAAEKLKTTFVKGSPYLYSQFSDPSSPEVYLPAGARFFNDSNTTILAADGDTVTADHIGIAVTNSNGAPTPEMVTRHYGLYAPAGTTFKRVGAKLKNSAGRRPELPVPVGSSGTVQSELFLPARLCLRDGYEGGLYLQRDDL
ncbi:hypothetical protein ACFTAO_38560 [Paenibacillus rhizoplanae]